MGPPVTYQANQAATTSGGFDSFNVNAAAPETNH
jgi:U1 small nuclear ribonucleoprotein C